MNVPVYISPADFDRGIYYEEVSSIFFIFNILLFQIF